VSFSLISTVSSRQGIAAMVQIEKENGTNDGARFIQNGTALEL
jgi:hypothetical protein